MASELARDLHANLVGQLHAVPPATRARSRWVMNLEWLNECRRLSWEASPVQLTEPETMLGLPVQVREDGGFPHLIAD
jgi:hypothetical protein